MTILSQKEPSSVQFNGIEWRVSRLGGAILLNAPHDIAIEQIHSSTRYLKELLGPDLRDIVPSYQSIGLFLNKDFGEICELLEKAGSETVAEIHYETVEVPVCYEKGLDLAELADHSGLSEEDVIRIHLNGDYRVILIGFTPGFIYLDGLDERLACPRKSNPRKKLEAGSVGIGGTQAGIYSLNSPGGWNILGQTPIQLFDKDRRPPMVLDVGVNLRFKRISLNEFETWQN